MQVPVIVIRVDSLHVFGVGIDVSLRQETTQVREVHVVGAVVSPQVDRAVLILGNRCPEVRRERAADERAGRVDVGNENVEVPVIRAAQNASKPDLSYEVLFILRIVRRLVLQTVRAQDVIELAEPPRFVSRGGEKLLAALEAFELTDLAGRICVDVGASTGGFTDCLLQHGAVKVYAIDVGYGVLDWKLRNDARVVVMERTNARFVSELPEEISLVTIDASFI